jgi:hypothetical protein
LRNEEENSELLVKAPGPPSTRERVDVRDDVVDHLEDLPRSEDLATLATAEPKNPGGPLEPLAPASFDAKAGLDLSLQAVHDLSSGSPDRVRGVLGAETPLAAPLISLAIPLLASKEFHLDAIQALRKIAGRATGQLADALCDPSVGFDVRRRIPRVLSACPTQSAADALIRGTDDERFEVRYACGRALLRITASDATIVIPLPTVIAIVTREVAHSREVWDSQRAPDLDDEEKEPPAFIDRLLRDRFDRSFEHVFSILALVLDRESIRIALKALHQEDERLRGTALEYLETVLPDEVRDAVWPFLGEARPMRPARPASEILADLVNAREVSKAERDDA